MTFRCPKCGEACINVSMGLGEVKSKSDARLLTPDQRQLGLMVTAQCPSCALQHVLVAPVFSAVSQEIKFAPEAKKLTPTEARARGFEAH